MSARGKAIGLFTIAAIVGALSFLTQPGRKSLRRAKRSLQTAHESLPKLKRAILGNTRGAVAAIFGPPHATVASHVHIPAKDYWRADTWYYPLDFSRHTAVAIRFANNIADHVDFIAGPGQRQPRNRKSP